MNFESPLKGNIISNPILNRRNKKFSSTLDNPEMMDIREKIKINRSIGDEQLKNVWFSNQKENNLDVYKTEGVNILFNLLFLFYILIRHLFLYP